MPVPFFFDRDWYLLSTYDRIFAVYLYGGTKGNQIPSCPGPFPGIIEKRHKKYPEFIRWTIKSKEGYF